MTQPDSTALHQKYRPKTLEEVVGHREVVAALRGVVKTGKWPSAIAFFGPPSAGKTTLAKALVADALGIENVNGPDYTYANMSSERSIEDVRQLMQVARLSPMGGKRRFIHLEEAQGLVGNAAAAAAILEPLENPHKRMTWLISSMSPEKFSQSQNGRAILSRCQQFHLKSYPVEDLAKQANRIVKGEELTFFTKELRDVVVQECNGEMRAIANLIQGLAQYYEGLPEDDRPEKLTLEAAQKVIQNSVGDDDITAVRLLTAVYAKKMAAAQREILGVSDGFGIINKMLYLNYAVMNDLILKGARHPKVWMTATAKGLKANLEKVIEDPALRMAAMVSMQQHLINLKSEAQAFAVPEDMAIFRFAARAMQ